MSDASGVLTDRRGRPRWVRRAVVATGATTLVVAATARFQLEPQVLPIALLVALVVLAAGLLDQAVLPQAMTWYAPYAPPSLVRGRDPVAMSHARHLEAHFGDRRPDPIVRDRLAALADQVLFLRHGESLRTEGGRALLAPEVVEVLVGPVRRLSLRTVESCVRAIEEL